jgi:uncharacterized cupredoxin-like copper-binding protein
MGALVATVVLGAPAAFAQQATEITVIQNESSFSPKTVTLMLGQPVVLNLQNQGKADHNMVSDLPLSSVKYQRADNSASDLHRYEANNIFDLDAKSGHTSVVVFTPSKAGTFEFHSDENEDQALGMNGSFVVQTAGGGASVTAPAASTATAPAATAGSPSTSSTVARDGQNLAGQPSATQAVFTAIWGGAAAQRWVQEHDAELTRLGR